MNKNEQCPLVSVKDSKYIHANEAPKEVKFQAQNFWFASAASKDDFSCQFTSTFGVKNVPGRFEGTSQSGILTCNPYIFPLPKNGIQYKVEVQIKSKQIFIDEKDGDIQLTIYECPKSDSCSKCLSHPPEFQCGFCAKKGSGNHETQCSIYSESDCNDGKRDYFFFNANMACPNPVITDFSPKSAPDQGGSIITITGENFAKEMGTSLAGSNCIYESCGDNWRNQYCCKLEKHGTESGLVSIFQMENGKRKTEDFDFNANSNDLGIPNFSIVSPEIMRISPTKLVRRGGQRMTITGKNLDAGSSREILISAGDNNDIRSICEIRYKSSEKIVCEIKRNEAVTQVGS